MKAKVFKTVKIQVVSTGVNFGCYAVIRDMRGRKLAETIAVRPASMRNVAYQDGLRLVAERGWIPEDLHEVLE